MVFLPILVELHTFVHTFDTFHTFCAYITQTCRDIGFLSIKNQTKLSVQEPQKN